MDKLYKKMCEIEMWVAIICLALSVIAIFSSSILRTVKMPIRWGLDVALLLFTWSTFLGLDIAFRKKCLVRVDMLIIRLPVGVQKILEGVVYALILSAIIFLFVYGVKLTLVSRARLFNGIPQLSYSLVTLSVPVSMFLMFITALTQIKGTYFPKKDAA